MLVYFWSLNALGDNLTADLARLLSLGSYKTCHCMTAASLPPVEIRRESSNRKLTDVT